MKFNFTLPRRFHTGAVVAAALAATGWVTRPLEQPAWDAISVREPALQLDSLTDVLGQGITVGLLGGFRAIVADFFWLKACVEWEDTDLPTTQTFLKVATTIDPRPIYFWTNGARWIAYDMPSWRIAEEGGYDVVPKSRQHAIDLEQAEVALRYLNEGLTYHPQSSTLYLDIANIHFQRRLDTATAVEFYRKAYEQPDAPYYIGRIYAVLLEKIGRNQEAYDWLVHLYPTLPKAPGTPGAEKSAQPGPPPSQIDIDAAEADEVLERIRKLEKTLAIPPEKIFQP